MSSTVGKNKGWSLMYNQLHMYIWWSYKVIIHCKLVSYIPACRIWIDNVLLETGWNLRWCANMVFWNPCNSLNCELNKQWAALIRLSLRSLPFNSNARSDFLSLRVFIHQSWSFSFLMGDLSGIILWVTWCNTCHTYITSWWFLPSKNQVFNMLNNILTL